MTRPTTRPYRKRKRARQEEETRRRITEAVMELHRTVGPVNTTVTDVARLAGVSRMTVYNHFPAEADLIEACSTHWAGLHPFPDPAAWSGLSDRSERLSTALRELYGWYEGAADMMENVLRDAPVVEPLGAVMASTWGPYLEGVVETLASGWTGEAASDRDLACAVRVAVDLGTWRLLVDSAGDVAEAARLATLMVEGVLRPAR
jgi:AcrR family transcriptional regulator